MMSVRRWLALGAAVLLSVGVMTVAGARPQGQQQPTITSRSLTQQSCFQSGSGATFFRPCVSIHGNVFSLQAPSGFEHINIATDLEGYGICSNLGYVYDAGFSEAGFGAQTITQPGGANTLPLTIARTGGGFRVTQTYARDTTQREFNITMAVKNITASSITNVKIARFFDGDVDNSTANIYDSSADGVWGRNVHGLALQSVSLATTHAVAIEQFGQLTAGLAGGVCNIPTNPGPTVSGDYAGVSYYSFSSIAAGATKTVKFTYRVI
jgi:hypothetical protein